MKPKTLIPLLLGLGVGVFAIKMGVDMVQRAKGAQGGDKTVFVSAKQIDTATRLTDTMVSSSTVPGALVPPNAFTDRKSLVGRVTAMAIPPGIPITAAMLAPPGSEPGLRAIIPPGHRAVSVSVTEESAVAGFLVPGSRVDVSTADEKARMSKLLLTNVEVGAVGQSLSEVTKDGKASKVSKSVTLFLKPEEVQVLNAHAGKGRIRLALRGNTGEPGESFLMKLAKSLVAPDTSPAVVSTPAPEPVLARQQVVEVVHGSEIEQVVFETSGAHVRRWSSKSGKPGAHAVAGPAPAVQVTPCEPVREMVE